MVSHSLGGVILFDVLCHNYGFSHLTDDNELEASVFSLTRMHFRSVANPICVNMGHSSVLISICPWLIFSPFINPSSWLN